MATPTNNGLPANGLVGIILRGEAYRNHDASSFMASQSLAHDDSRSSCVPTIDATRLQMCATTALLDKVVRPLVRDLGNTIHLSLVECSRRLGCPLVERTLLPLLQHEPGVHLVGNRTRCRSRTQSENLRFAVTAFMDGSLGHGVKLRDYQLVLILRHDMSVRDGPITHWTGDFGRFNFMIRRCRWQKHTDDKNGPTFMIDSAHALPGRYLRRWVEGAIGHDGCFGQGVDPTRGHPHGHYCREVTSAALGGDDRVGTLQVFPCEQLTEAAVKANMNSVFRSDPWPYKWLCVPSFAIDWHAEATAAALRTLRGAGYDGLEAAVSRAQQSRAGADSLALES